MTQIPDQAVSDEHGTPLSAPCALPSPEAWRTAALRHGELFAPLVVGARIALLPRTAPTRTLLWEAGEDGIDARVESFAGFAACAADIVLAADDSSLCEIRRAIDGGLFEALRAGIRAGHIVCYVLKRRCVLEERGFEEMLEALGFAFMGACR